MTALCKYCKPAPSSAIWELPEAKLLLPDPPHIASREGGHLVVAAGAHVQDRRALTPTEALAMDFLTMIAADALRAVFGADWQNFQENGNWQKHPGRGHAHIHVYGRRRDAREQPFGEALRFPLRSERDEWQVQAPTPDEVEEIRVFVQRNQEAYPAFDAAMAMTQELSD